MPDNYCYECNDLMVWHRHAVEVSLDGEVLRSRLGVCRAKDCECGECVPDPPVDARRSFEQTMRMDL